MNLHASSRSKTEVEGFHVGGGLLGGIGGSLIGREVSGELGYARIDGYQG